MSNKKAFAYGIITGILISLIALSIIVYLYINPRIALIRAIHNNQDGIYAAAARYLVKGGYASNYMKFLDRADMVSVNRDEVEYKFYIGDKHGTESDLGCFYVIVDNTTDPLEIKRWDVVLLEQ
jgi:hypothetical protein